MLYNLQNCQYKGDYCPKHQTIQLFWDVFRELTHGQKKQFLSEFSTIIKLDILRKNSWIKFLRFTKNTKNLMKTNWNQT